VRRSAIGILAVGAALVIAAFVAAYAFVFVWPGMPPY
jgi:hypothetical protein